MIYDTARERLGLDASQCVVIEDSVVGLRAAKGAGMNCIITYTESTASADFYGEGADAKMFDLQGVTIKEIFDPLLSGGGAKALLKSRRDPNLKK